MKIGDYPTEVFKDEPFELYLHVGNQEGKIMYYTILVKLGDASSIINDSTPMNAPILEEFNCVLLTGANWTQPVTLNIDKTATNLRLTFELWVFNESLQYDGRFCQIWMNVTERSNY